MPPKPPLQGIEVDDKIRHRMGQIAAARATLALTRYQADVMVAQSLRALEYLSPRNLTMRANANWTLGFAYLLQGDRTEPPAGPWSKPSLTRAAGDIFTTIAATLGLGQVQEVDNELYQAAETSERPPRWQGGSTMSSRRSSSRPRARTGSEWNDLDGAEQHGRQGLLPGTPVRQGNRPLHRRRSVMARGETRPGRPSVRCGL